VLVVAGDVSSFNQNVGDVYVFATINGCPTSRNRNEVVGRIGMRSGSGLGILFGTHPVQPVQNNPVRHYTASGRY
jgi:hypothetical protein